MFGLFTRTRPRPEPASDENRISLAEIEALLREIAADPSGHGATAKAEEPPSSRGSDRDPASELA